MMNRPIHKILALLPNWLGDVAMCTPALRALHRRFPEADFAVAGRAAACEVLHGLPWFSAIVPIPARPGLWELPSLGRRLRPHAADLAVVFPHSFRAALLARLTGAQRRLGYDRDGRAVLLTDTVTPRREKGRIEPRYMAQEYLDLLGPLGCQDDGVGLELRADPQVVDAVSRHFTTRRPRIGFAPGGAFGPSKRWLPERFARVADGLADRLGAQCILLTGPGEEEIRDAVAVRATTSFVVCDGSNSGIEALKAAIAQLDLLICNDSGPRHVAVAFHVPIVCIMGPTSPRYSEGPYERGRVVRVDVDCGPCQKPICKTDHGCMTRITVDMVIEAALHILGENAANGSKR